MIYSLALSMHVYFTTVSSLRIISIAAFTSLCAANLALLVQAEKQALESHLQVSEKKSHLLDPMKLC